MGGGLCTCRRSDVQVSYESETRFLEKVRMYLSSSYKRSIHSPQRWAKTTNEHNDAINGCRKMDEES
ncbi:hypothetical protein A2U01_0059196 [Trifolium medium]|uniref:Uncharacterized protein n=1 Tax=Trifolium medium TaxID=97028 RepID=A0A392RMU4_9FABA|nr:hypothetical protein [Trifolium medium]